MSKFKGSFVALATPFNSDFELDRRAFSELVEWQIAEGTDGIMISSTTGEAPTLTLEEQSELLKMAIEINRGRAVILAGTGSNDTKKSVQLTEQAKKAGADGCLVIFPYYNRPSFAGCLAHFREIAKVGLPMMIYYHPVRTALKLSVDQLLELCAIDGVVALKESPGDVELAVEFMQRSPISYFSGDDPIALPLLAAGAAGVCSVIANIIPREWKGLCDAIDQEKLSDAREIYNRYFPLCKALFLESNPIGIKYALSLLGRCAPHLRLPLIEPQEATKKKIRETMKQVGLIESAEALFFGAR